MTAGLNASLHTDDLGTYNVRCRRLYLGLAIISSEAEGKARRVFYPATTTSSAFMMEIQFPSYESQMRFSTWLQTYMESTISGRGFKAVVDVSMPSRNFKRQAIPVGPAMFGEGVTDVVRLMQLNFVGAHDALDISLDTKKSHSYFQLPTKDVKTSKNFYPGGIQLSGAASLEGSLFDDWTGTGGTGSLDDPGTESPQAVGP